MQEFLDNLLTTYNLTAIEWPLVIFCGMLVGFAKTGFSGVGILIVPILAGILGARPSVGFLLPMLSLGDFFAVRYYHRHADWSHVLRLIPPTLVGLGLGVFVGHKVDANTFRLLIAGSVILGLILIIWLEKQKDPPIPHHWTFAAFMGLAAGFTTMIGNAAGPVMAIYLLSMRLPRYAYIGTAAWFCVIINLTKVPFHVFIWETITLESFCVNLAMLPAIAVGAVCGVALIKRVPERPFRIVIIIFTAIAAVRLLIA